MYKVNHERLLSAFANLFMKVNQVHEYQTRESRYAFLPPEPNTSYNTISFSHRSAVA